LNNDFLVYLAVGYSYTFLAVVFANRVILIVYALFELFGLFRPMWTAFMTTGLDRTYHAHRFIFSFTF